MGCTSLLMEYKRFCLNFYLIEAQIRFGLAHIPTSLSRASTFAACRVGPVTRNGQVFFKDYFGIDHWLCSNRTSVACNRLVWSLCNSRLIQGTTKMSSAFNGDHIFSLKSNQYFNHFKVLFWKVWKTTGLLLTLPYAALTTQIPSLRVRPFCI